MSRVEDVNLRENHKTEQLEAKTKHRDLQNRVGELGMEPRKLEQKGRRGEQLER